MFDVITKLYFATDYVPADSDIFAVCADMLDVYMDFSFIYGSEKPEQKDPHLEPEPYEVVIKLSDKKALMLQQVSE